MTDAVVAWYEKYNCDRFEIPASFTWLLQAVDVSIAAQYKNSLFYTSWCSWMLETIEQNKFRQKSLNYVSPSKALAIQWCAESWQNISKSNIVNGCRKCYMNPGVPNTEAENYRGQNLDDINWAAENLKI